jgi:hypothetical protein
MKLRRINFLMALFIALLSCDTEGDFKGDFEDYFVKYYGEDGNQEGKDLIVNEDGTLLLLGTSRLPDNSSRILLVKTDYNGNIQWQKKLGGSAENAADIEATGDGNFFILSNIYLGKDLTTNEDRYDMKVIKVSPQGEKLDSMVFNNNEANDKKWNTQFMRSLTVLDDGGFIVTGNSTDESIFVEPLSQPDQEDIITIVFNADLTYRWKVEATFSEYTGSGVKVFEHGGQYYLLGYSDKLDAVNGDLTYESNFNAFRVTQTQYAEIAGASFAGSPAAADDEVLYAACEDPFGNGYYEIGTQSDLPQQFGDLYYASRNESFFLTQQGTIKGITGAFRPAGVAPAFASDGFLIVADEQVATGMVMRLIKVNLNNDTEWSLSLGSASHQSTGAAVSELPDGRIVVLGTMGLETQRKMALIKVDSNGEFLK